MSALHWIIGASTLALAACGPGSRGETTVDACASGCDASPGCDPTKKYVCVGNDLRVCENGAIGPIRYQCESCREGGCEFQPCTGAAQRLYVLVEGALRTYDPDQTSGAFGLARVPDCNIGAPFSMTIDRLGRAWVVLSDGFGAKLALVDPDHGYCEVMPEDLSESGFARFTLTFVPTTNGASTDHLIIAGGSYAAFTSKDTRAAVMDPDTLAITPIGTLPGAPDITGTDDGRLFGYFPFSSPPHVAEIDPASAQPLTTWDLPQLNGTARGWGVAFWKGRVIAFDSRSSSMLGPVRNRIFAVDVATGDVDTLDDDSPYEVIGAGVSTCFQIVL